MRTIKTDAEWNAFFEKQKKYGATWRAKPENKAKMKAANLRWRERNPEKAKAYRQKYNKQRWIEIKAARARLAAK